MVGDVGPYVGDSEVWVPRTVPYLKARHIAQNANQVGDRLVYVGKSEATLLGYTRECYCEDYCIDEYDDTDQPTGETPCRVPAWHFRLEER